MIFRGELPSIIVTSLTSVVPEQSQIIDDGVTVSDVGRVGLEFWVLLTAAAHQT